MPDVTAAPLGPKPVVLFNFDSKRIVDKWHVFTDASFGGKSQASISYNKQEQVIGSMDLFDLGPNPLRLTRACSKQQP